MALSTILEESEINLLRRLESSTAELNLSTMSSLETVVHIEIRTSGEIPNDTFGRLAFCMFDMRRPRSYWIPLLRNKTYIIIFMAALEHYVKLRPEYTFIWENVLLSGEMSRRTCVYAMKELHDLHSMRVDVMRGYY